MSRDPKHLFLTGYRGCGKSTVGRLLAILLDRPFYDTDVLIEQQSGRPIREIFLTDGEPAFRDLETQTLAATAAFAPSVIALGGGAIVRETNRSMIRQHGYCVWLRASADRLATRIAADETAGRSRPSLTGSDPVAEVRSVLTSREPWYREASDWSVETDDVLPEEVARTIAEWYAALR